MTTSANGTQAVDRAAELLTRVVHGREPVSFTELTAASGLAKSTTSRLLTALERHQLVRRDHGGKFWPGEMFVRYAWRGTAGTDLVAIARPFLDQLGEQTRETINLGVVAGAGGGGAAGSTTRAGGGGAGGAARISVQHRPVVEQIAQVDSRYLIGGTNWVGLAVPLHCSAQGKVLLAFGAAVLPPGRLEARTPRTITSRTDLEADLARAREQGWALTDEELEPGLVAVAAPVFAGARDAIAAISVSGPSARLTQEQFPAVAARCVAAASDLSAALSGGQAAAVTAPFREPVATALTPGGDANDQRGTPSPALRPDPGW